MTGYKISVERHQLNLSRRMSKVRNWWLTLQTQPEGVICLIFTVFLKRLSQYFQEEVL